MGCATSFLQRVAPAKGGPQLLRSRSADRDDASVLTQPSEPASPKPTGLIYRSANSGAKGLIALAKAGDLVKGRELLMSGADPSAPGMWGSTPLLVACEYGRQEFAELLLSHHCEVDTPNSKGATPLLYACVEGFQTIVDKLIAQGATVEPDVAIVYNSKRDIVGPLTPLAAAAANGFVLVVNKLLDSGVQVNRALAPVGDASMEDLPYAGATALSIACATGETRVVQTLLAASADITIADFKGRTALHHACTQTESPELVDILTNHICSNRKLDKMGVINATNLRNETALHIACAKGGLHTLEVLLNAGADPNITSTSHITPLHVAVQKGCKAGVGLLISRGADPTIQDLQKQTPYDMAIKLNRQEIVQLLLRCTNPPAPPLAIPPTNPPVEQVNEEHTLPVATEHGQPETEVEAIASPNKRSDEAATPPLQPTLPSAKKAGTQSPRAARVAKPHSTNTSTKPSNLSKQARPSNQNERNTTPKKPAAPRTPSSTLTNIRHKSAPTATKTQVASGEEGATVSVAAESLKSQVSLQPSPTNS